MSDNIQDTQISDLAEILSEAWTEIINRAPTPQGVRTETIISQWLNLSDPGLLPELVGAMAQRLRRLRQLVDFSPDPHLTAKTKNSIRTRIDSILSLLQASMLVAQWVEVKQRINLSDLVVVSTASPSIRLIHPLRIFTLEEVSQAIKALEAAVESLTEVGLPPWAEILVRDGLERQIFVLTYLPAFGQERALDELFLARTKIESVEKELPLEQGVQKGWLREAAALVLYIAGAFAAPYEAYQAGDAYLRQLSSASASILSHIPKTPSQQRPFDPPMLPAPRQVEAEEKVREV